MDVLALGMRSCIRHDAPATKGVIVVTLEDETVGHGVHDRRGKPR